MELHAPTHRLLHISITIDYAANALSDSGCIPSYDCIAVVAFFSSFIEQGWRSGERTRVPPTRPRCDSVLDAIRELSLLVLNAVLRGFTGVLRFSSGSSGFRPGTPVSPSHQKPKI